MKYLLPLLLCFRCVAQLPVIPATGTGGSPTPPFSLLTVSNAYLVLMSDSNTSVTNTVNNSIMGTWFNLVSSAHNFTNSSASPSENAFYSTTGGPTGQPSVHYGSAGSVLGLVSVDTLSNQPNTFYFAVKLSQIPNGFFNSYRFMDSISGGREVIQANPETAGEFTLFYAGSVVNGPAVTNAMWMVWTAVFNGTSSICRTNWGANTNGDALFGNSGIGSGAQGKMILGADNAGARDIQGDIVCVIACSAVHSTNYMQQVEQGIRAHYGF